mmetsp:Transcript_7093/g.20104  ORF Transcript_7093/g.20104 Transcript_7093/m.20104 type:complete len:209 (-) Transcript_7093:697-1323(-)
MAQPAEKYPGSAARPHSPHPPRPSASGSGKRPGRRAPCPVSNSRGTGRRRRRTPAATAANARRGPPRGSARSASPGRPPNRPRTARTRIRGCRRPSPRGRRTDVWRCPPRRSSSCNVHIRRGRPPSGRRATRRAVRSRRCSGCTRAAACAPTSGAWPARTRSGATATERARRWRRACAGAPGEADLPPTSGARRGSGPKASRPKSDPR